MEARFLNAATMGNLPDVVEMLKGTLCEIDCRDNVMKDNDKIY